MKELGQIDHGIETRWNFSHNKDFPADSATEFLHQNENKSEVYPYFVSKVIEGCQQNEKLVGSRKNDKVIMNVEGNLAEIGIPDCSHPEADTRIILHVLSCYQSRVEDVYIWDNDTEVVVLLSTYMPDFFKTNSKAKIVAQCGISMKSFYLSINAIAGYIVLERCKELLFLYFLLIYDYTSSLFHLRKVKF